MVPKDQAGPRIEVERRTDLIKHLRTMRATINQIVQEYHNRFGLNFIRFLGDVIEHRAEKVCASMDVGDSIHNRRKVIGGAHNYSCK